MLPSFSCMEDKARELQNLLLRCCGMRIPLMPEPQLSLEGAGRRKSKCSKSSPAQTSPEVVEKKERREKQMPSPHRSRPRMSGGEGENWENKGRLWKIKQESRWSRPDPAAWLWLTCESHPLSSPSLRSPTGNNCEVSALLQSLPRLPFFRDLLRRTKQQ